MIEALLNLGVNKAEQVVLTGCSGISNIYIQLKYIVLFTAGAHATYLHVDRIRRMIPSDIPLHGFADAGYVGQSTILSSTSLSITQVFP